MIRNIILGLIAVGGILVFTGTRSRGQNGEIFVGGPALYKEASWTQFKFQKVSPTKARNYDFTFTVTTRTGPHLRLAFDQQDERNYYFADLTVAGIRLGRMEENFESTLDADETQSLEAGKTYDIRLKRRGEFMALNIDDRLVLQATDLAFSNGSIYLGTPDDSVDVPKAPRLQPAGDMFFDDDFMRPSDELGVWDVIIGEWGVRSLDNPSLSANAFTFEGHSSGRPATAVAGYTFWDGYTVQSAVRGAGCGEIGLIFYANGFNEQHRIQDYYAFRWSPEDKQAVRKNLRQLVHVKNGESRVLAEAEGGYLTGQWYELKVSIKGKQIRTFIDGRPIFVVMDEHAVGGKFGLYTSCDHPGCTNVTSFDDVQVKPTDSLNESFTDSKIAGWKTFGGKWKSKEGTLTCQSRKACRAVTGQIDWKNYRVEADADLGESEWAGLIAAYLDEGAHLLYRVSALGKQQLIRWRDGTPEILQEKPGLPAQWKPGLNRMSLELNYGVLTAYANGLPQFHYWIGSGARGMAGLYAEKAKGTRFDNVTVEPIKGNVPVLNVNPVFAREKSMANWAAADSDWPNAGRYSEPGAYLTSHVHRMEFFDDVEFTITVERIESLRKLRLSIGTDAGDLIKGYHFTIEPFLLSDTPPSFAPEQNEPNPNIGWKAVLYHQQKMLTDKRLQSGTTPSDLHFRRTGMLLIASVNSEPVLTHEISEEPTGTRIGYAYSGGRIMPTKTKVQAKESWCYAFRQATTDWRVGSGQWQVTNRWECDPRWTFFAGFNSQLACIWNKRLFEGDICVDLAASIKMDRNRGSRYEYASDLDVTICGDGKDLSSGYSFIFGGDNNRSTFITRNGKIVAQRQQTIPIHSNIHRRWFHLKVVKHSSHLYYYIDDELVLEYEDPMPLPGKQVGLWTWNNGIMVAQVRISGKGSQIEEPSRKLRETPYCYYTLPSLDNGKQ